MTEKHKELPKLDGVDVCSDAPTPRRIVPFDQPFEFPHVQTSNGEDPENLPGGGWRSGKMG